MFSILYGMKGKLTDAMIDSAIEKHWITADQAAILRA